jgi:hypothetical protein
MSVKIFLEFHSFCLSVNVYGVGHSITANGLRLGDVADF